MCLCDSKKSHTVSRRYEAPLASISGPGSGAVQFLSPSVCVFLSFIQLGSQWLHCVSVFRLHSWCVFALSLVMKAAIELLHRVLTKTNRKQSSVSTFFFISICNNDILVLIHFLLYCTHHDFMKSVCIFESTRQKPPAALNTRTLMLFTSLLRKTWKRRKDVCVTCQCVCVCVCVCVYLQCVCVCVCTWSVCVCSSSTVWFRSLSCSVVDFSCSAIS